MGEELDHFLEEQKAKLAQDRVHLENDLPYMEIRSPPNIQDSTTKESTRPTWQRPKEAAPMKQGDSGYSSSLPLGEEYEKKKQKLIEELRLDYRRYLNQKHLNLTGEVDATTHGLSLPIGERLSGKERLRLERNKEYNQFLRMKDEEDATFRSRTIAQRNTQADKPIVTSRVNPEPYTSVHLSHRDQDFPRKDASTSMEAYERLLNQRRSEEDGYRREDVETDERHGRRAEERISKNFIRSDLEADMMAKPPLNLSDYEYVRRPQRIYVDNNVREDNLDNQMYEVDLRDGRPLKYSHPAERKLPQHIDRKRYEYDREQASYFQVQRNENRDRRERAPPMDYEDDFREQTKQRPITSLAKSRVNKGNLLPATERSKSAHVKEEVFSTGLLLGGSDQDEAQRRRKERYRQELMEQMAEQQRNKRREKELELRVAATGAIDPEKQPDRLRQFGAINRPQEVVDHNIAYRPGVTYDPEKIVRRNEQKPAYEERAPPEKARVAFQTPTLESAVIGNEFPVAANPANEQFHRGLASALGEIVVPRIAAFPPPQPPVLPDNYRTPYDDAYYFYGARNPLDPNLAYYHPSMMGPPTSSGISIPITKVLQAEDLTVLNTQRAAAGRGTRFGLIPEDKPKHSKESAQSYQEALAQQIRERNEKLRKEKEEQERYEAKLEADIKKYNPWGRGGGGAPLKDSKGNLITDLKRMHQQNEDAYQQPETRAYADKRSVVAVDLSLADNSGSTSKIPGFAFASNSQFARGSVFAEPPTEQQVHQQESYKNFLRLQIEEKQHKEREERELIRLEEEKEERRLADQRAKIQREYEEEQNRKKLKEEEQRQKNEELIRIAEDRRKAAEIKRKEEEEKQEEELRRFYEQEKSSKSEEAVQPPRPPSPVIPTLQKKAPTHVQRPPTADSQISAQSQEDAKSRAISPPVPARRNQLRAYDDKRNVISELSELRKQLRSEQRRLEGRLQDADRDDESSASLSGRRKDKNSMDVFDLARHKLKATVRRPSLKGMENINMENIRQFNDLKYRDTDTREGVRYMYPDPPKDDHTLEIQQQALLREQQKNLNRMKRRTWMPEDLEPAPAYSLRHAGMFKDTSSDLLKTSLLESESAFIGENGEPFQAFTEKPTAYHPAPSARERRRHKHDSSRAAYNDSPLVPAIPLPQDDRLSINSDFSLNVDEVRTRNEERLRKLSNLQKSSRTTDDDPDGLGDSADILKLFPSKEDRSHSVDTVATDPWLRPGTSETLKRFMAGQLNHNLERSENALPFSWQGLSTAHG
uniref:Centrosome and spindle pole associated protein 1 n=1 Tax=Leptobrachium leishanense TaxID=445787 RepID=A0A8C5PML4_9ANUR